MKNATENNKMLKEQKKTHLFVSFIYIILMSCGLIIVQYSKYMI